MPKPRAVPFATLVLVIFTAGLQILRWSNPANDDLILRFMDIEWETAFLQPWRLIPSAFLHTDVLHLLQNIGFLFLFGWQIERSRGAAWLLGVFFGAIAVTGVLDILVAHVLTWGISGGVTGLFGFSLIANRRTPWWTTLTRRPLHILYTLNLLAAVYADVADLVPYPIAHFAHVVGIAYGAAVGAAFLLEPRRTGARVAVSALPVLLMLSLLYSPWSPEWRLVQRQPTLVTAEADCRVHAPAAPAHEEAVGEVVNASGRPIAIYWMDEASNPGLSAWMAAGQTDAQAVHSGHGWCIVDAETGEALQAVVVTEDGASVTVR